MPTESISTVGSGGDYSTLELWQSGLPNKNLVARDVIEVAEVIGGTNVGNPTSRIFFDGSWTTDSTHYPLIRAQAGSEHQGTGELDTTKAYIQGNFSFSNSGLVQAFGPFHIEDIQLDLTSQSSSMRVWFNYFGAFFSAKRCLFRHTVDASVTTGNFEGLFFEQRNPTAAINIENCIMVGEFSGNANGCIGIYIQGSNAFEHTIRQNTMVITGGTGGVKDMLSCRDSHDIDSQNNYYAIPSTSSGNIYNSSVGSSITKGANDATSNSEATTVALQGVAYDTGTFVNVTDGTLDLTPVTDGPLFDAGADLTSVGVTDDFLGTARPQGDAYDIGAIESQDVVPDPVVVEITSIIEPLLSITSTLEPETATHATAEPLLEITSTIGLA